MAQMPDIQPEINKEPEREKKRGGFFARFFGGGSGGTVGAGSFGGIGAGGAGGGLLATKAGLIALILAGTTVAGGIGLVGYRLFGPGQDQSNGEGLQLFASKPKGGSSDASASSAAPKDGNSASLDYLAKANTAPKEPEAKPEEAPKDKAAADAALDAKAAAAGGAHGAINAAGAAGDGVNRNMLKTGSNFGSLSKNFGGGGSAVTSAVPSAAGAGSSDANAAKGSLSAMKKGTSVPGGASRAVASRRGSNSGMRQALGVLGDNRGAATSYGAGRTYDGTAAQNTGNIGPTGGAIGASGTGAGTSGTQATSSPNTATQAKEFKAPPTPTSTDSAPWQKAIDTARTLIGIAAALLLVGKLLAKTQYGRTYAMIIAALVGALGAMVIALGAQVAGGQYGQKAQGAILAAAGAGLVIAAAATVFGGSSNSNSSGLNMSGADSSGASGASGASSASDFTAGVNTWVLIGGGLAVARLAGSMMMPLQKYPSSQFENGNPPDTHFFGG